MDPSFDGVRAAAQAKCRSSSTPTGVADDHRLRSSYVRELVWRHRPLAARAPSARFCIPKVIVQFWDASPAIPTDVSECLDSWRSAGQASGFTHILFDDASAERFIARSLGRSFAEAFALCPHPAMRSDYFRLCYIFTRGGFYVDADEVCSGRDLPFWFCDCRLKVQPLCYDTLTEAMVPADVFRHRQNDSSNWIFYVNNNPLIAPARHPVIQLALRRATHLLLYDGEERLDIQATTGPGNLTRSLVEHALTVESSAPEDRDFAFLSDWDAFSTSRWPLSYRDDERNWRLWTPSVVASPNGRRMSYHREDEALK
jgi:Glycosyltransferase sugar-binding region containing DXD motif